MQLLAASSLILLLLFATGGRAQGSSALDEALESITTDELREHVEVLADDVFEGREAGTRGGKAAAKYLLQQIRPMGLIPAGDSRGYQQRFQQGWQNLLLLKPGSDSELKDQVVVVGAHYDHVGYGARGKSYGPLGTIHNGADDNASGVAVLLEVIEGFCESQIPTKRSVLFAFWDGEEQGLVGSEYWLAHPTIDPPNIRLAITVDMVGRLRDEGLFVLGTRSGYGMRRFVSGLAEVPLAFSWDLSANSDHWPFLQQQIPVALLHTGLHKDYHRPSDDAEKINYEGMRIVGRFLTQVIAKAASEVELPAYRAVVEREMSDRKRRALERPLEQRDLDAWPPNEPKPRLGLSWREDEAEPGTVFVTRVVHNSPADDAGVQVHDRIHALNGQHFGGSDELKRQVQEALTQHHVSLSLLTERRGDLQTIQVHLPIDERPMNRKSDLLAR